MPFLDVSAAITNPMICDVFAVRRQTENVTRNGRAAHMDQSFPLVYGLVTPEGDNSHERSKDYTAGRKTLSVITKFPLRDQVKNALPDIVIWGGNEFIVIECVDMTHFGSGFVEAICTCDQFVVATPGAR